MSRGWRGWRKGELRKGVVIGQRESQWGAKLPVGRGLTRALPKAGGPVGSPLGCGAGQISLLPEQFTPPGAVRGKRLAEVWGAGLSRRVRGDWLAQLRGERDRLLGGRKVWMVKAYGCWSCSDAVTSTVRWEKRRRQTPAYLVERHSCRLVKSPLFPRFPWILLESSLVCDSLPTSLPPEGKSQTQTWGKPRAVSSLESRASQTEVRGTKQALSRVRRPEFLPVRSHELCGS